MRNSYPDINMGAEPIFMRDFAHDATVVEETPVESSRPKQEAKHARRTPPDFSALPVTIERQHTSTGQIVAMLILLIAALVGLAIVAVRLEVNSIAYIVLAITVGTVPLTCMASGIVFWIGQVLPGGPFSEDQETITIGERFVSVHRTGIFGGENWTVPTQTFTAICWNSFDKSDQVDVGSMVELINTDHAKNIVLYGSDDADKLSAVLYQAAAALNLPIVYRHAKRPDEYFRG